MVPTPASETSFTEILASRVRIHDELGQIILMTRKLIANEGTGGEALVIGEPCLQAPAETTMGISWSVSGLAKGVVEYADNPEFKDSKRVKSGGYGLVPIDIDALNVRLEGLKPSTRYYYRTITTPFTDYRNIYNAKLGEPIVGATHSFQTLGPKTAAHICIFSDTHAQWPVCQQVAKKL